MKGIKRGLSVIITSTLLQGCQSTTNKITYDEDKLVKYESRCDVIEKTEKEALDTLPIVRVDPRVPNKAARSKIPGYVKMEFDIAQNGRPVNINVIESFPSDLFHTVAISALKKWRYKPLAVQCKSVQIDFEFL
jgi:TonB family protein